MKRLEEFRTMEDLLYYKKELETRITDDDLLEEVLDNVWSELLNINSYVDDIYRIKKSNSKWLSIIITLLESRANKESYNVKIVNDSGSKKKVYTLDSSLHHATVEENDIGKEYNVVMIENGKNSIVYDKFEGKFDINAYLEKTVDFSKISESLENMLSEKELRVLNKYIFDSYKEANMKGKVKTRKRG